MIESRVKELLYAHLTVMVSKYFITPHAYIHNNHPSSTIPTHRHHHHRIQEEKNSPVIPDCILKFQPETTRAVELFKNSIKILSSPVRDLSTQYTRRHRGFTSGSSSSIRSDAGPEPCGLPGKRGIQVFDLYVLVYVSGEIYCHSNSIIMSKLLESGMVEIDMHSYLLGATHVRFVLRGSSFSSRIRALEEH